MDKQLVSLLQEDGRMSFAEMARQVSLTEAQVCRRVVNLHDQGIFQNVAVTDPLQLGFTGEAMVEIKSVPSMTEVADALAEIDEVDFIVLVAGGFDLPLEVVAETDDAFVALIERIHGIVGESQITVIPYLKTWVQNYAWGKR